ncbi:HD domain-containing protein [Candidatus Peregrinibacteria bacterium]|nr:HD domain-containing protein [Candidatus Peregrinibacteria bacterium]
MTKEKIIEKTKEFVKEKLSGESSGHDWWHIYRVWKNAIHICANEKGVDLFTVELAALLHDIADYKFHDGDDSVGPQIAREWLEKLQVEEEVIAHICQIIQEASFKGANVKGSMKTKEGMIVQDADRLDAIGAIGIARTFAYGGNKGREMYNPNIQPTMHNSFDEYKNNKSPTVNHFYEKLLLLKDLMNTETAKAIAQERHEFMEQYLHKFYEEWEGKA